MGMGYDKGHPNTGALFSWEDDHARHKWNFRESGAKVGSLIRARDKRISFTF